MDSRPMVRRIEESQEAHLDVCEAAPGASIRLTVLSCVSCQLTLQLGAVAAAAAADAEVGAADAADETPELPEDALVSIFCQLPPRALLAALQVCSAWASAGRAAHVYKGRVFPLPAAAVLQLLHVSELACSNGSAATPLGRSEVGGLGARALWRRQRAADLAGGTLEGPLPLFVEGAPPESAGAAGTPEKAPWELPHARQQVARRLREAAAAAAAAVRRGRAPACRELVPRFWVVLDQGSESGVRSGVRSSSI